MHNGSRISTPFPCTRPPLQRAQVKGLTPERVLLLHAQTAASLRGQKGGPKGGRATYEQGKGAFAEEHREAQREGCVKGGQTTYEQGKGVFAEEHREAQREGCVKGGRAGGTCDCGTCDLCMGRESNRIAAQQYRARAADMEPAAMHAKVGWYTCSGCEATAPRYVLGCQHTGSCQFATTRLVLKQLSCWVIR